MFLVALTHWKYISFSKESYRYKVYRLTTATERRIPVLCAKCRSLEVNQSQGIYFSEKPSAQSGKIGAYIQRAAW